MSEQQAGREGKERRRRRRTIKIYSIINSWYRWTNERERKKIVRGKKGEGRG